MREMPVEILFSDRSAPLAAPTSMDGSAGGARIKLDLAERGLVVGHVLLQERHQRLGLLRAEIDPLKVSQFHLRLRALLHRPENEEEIPHIHPDLHAVGVGLAVIGGLHELHIRLVPCIHVWQCNAGQSSEAKCRAKCRECYPRNLRQMRDAMKTKSSTLLLALLFAISAAAQT